MSVERTGWRDQALSERHRAWGFNCPAVDLDFLLIEYHYGRPCALVEYKHRLARESDPSHPTIRAIVALADGYRDGALPAMVVRYDYDPWTFTVTPLNDAAAAIYGHRTAGPMTEQDFVRTLYRVRRKALSAHDEDAIGRLSADL